MTVLLALAADEDFDNNIVRGLLRRRPDLDLVRVQDAGLGGADDPAVLAWAAAEQRLLLTHDVGTMPDHADRRVTAGLSMPGVVAVSHRFPLGQAIDEILLIAEASIPGEWEGRVLFLPLK